MARNEDKRLRVGRVAVTLEVPAGTDGAIAACLPTFEDFCTVTQSVRKGIDVAVTIQQGLSPK
jgi:hypothetical protein